MPGRSCNLISLYLTIVNKIPVAMETEPMKVRFSAANGTIWRKRIEMMYMRNKVFQKWAE